MRRKDCFLILLTTIFNYIGLSAAATDDGSLRQKARRCVPCERLDWYQCTSSCVCIPQEKRCDRSFTDCGLKDLSDESHCGAKHYWNSTCVPEGDQPFAMPCKAPGGGDDCLVSDIWFCDTSNNCEDGSDEAPAICHHCPPGWLRCGSSSKCIPEHLECNGVDDCGSGEDERNCKCAGVEVMCDSSPDILGCGKFQRECKGIHPCFPFKANIDTRVFCDQPQQNNTCPGNGYAKCYEKLGLMRCLSKDLLCDGVPQCYGGADEKGTCPISRSPTQFMTLDSCHGACDQICEKNSSAIGKDSAKPTHKCSCYTGYKLSPHDQFSCIANTTYSNPATLLAAGKHLVSLVLDPDHFSNDTSYLHSTRGFLPRVLDSNLLPNSPLAVHVKQSLAFHVSKTGRAITVTNVTSENAVRTLQVQNKIGGITVDWTSDLLFWTEPDTGKIVASTLGGEKRHVIYSGFHRPTCIAAVPAKGFLLVCDTLLGSARIVSVRMSGNDLSQQTLVSASDNRWLGVIQNLRDNGHTIFPRFNPTALAIDYPNNILYFVENSVPFVAGLSLRNPGGSDSLFLLTETRQFAGQKLFGLDIFNNRLYVSEVRTRIAYQLFPLSARMLPGSEARVMTGHSIALAVPQSSSMDLKVFHPARQPPSPSRCPAGVGVCDYMCLPTATAHRCICPSGHRLVHGTMCELIIDPFLVFTTPKGIFRTKLPLVPDLQISPLFNASTIDKLTTRDLPVIGARAADIDWHPVSHRIFWSEPESHRIRSILHNGTKLRTELDHLGKPWGIAVDWVTDKLFWADVGNKTISVSELKPGGITTIIVWLDISTPQYVALDFEHGFVFWSDSGVPFRIERARMDGWDRQTIIAHEPSNPIGVPSKLTFDVADRVYFVAGSKIRRVTHHTEVSQNVLHEERCCKKFGNLSTFSLNVFNGSFFTSHGYTNDRYSLLQCPLSPDSGAQDITCDELSLPNDVIDLFAKEKDKKGVLSVSVFHQDHHNKPKRNVCLHKKTGLPVCEHLCFFSGFSEFVCSCPFGFQPDPSNSSACVPRTDDLLLIGSVSQLEMIYFSDKTDPNSMTQYPQFAHLPPDVNLDLWDYSPRNRYLYLYNSRLKHVERFNLLTGQSSAPFLRDRVIQSLAVDATHNLLFFVSDNAISVCDLHDTTHIRTLLTRNLTEPRLLTLDPYWGLIFFIDFLTPHGNTNQTVLLVQISMNGASALRTTVREFAREKQTVPLSLTIDLKNKQLVWIDQQAIISRMNYQPKGPEEDPDFYDSPLHTTHFEKDELPPWGGHVNILTTLDGELFWVERRRRVVAMHDNLNLMTSLSGPSFSLEKDLHVTNIKAVSHSQAAPNQCEDMSCSFICVPTDSGVGQCLCPEGVWLEKDNLTCEPSPRQFILTLGSRLLPEVPPSYERGGFGGDDGAENPAHYSCHPADYPADYGTPVAIDFHYAKKTIFVATDKGIFQYDFNLKFRSRVHTFEGSAGDSKVLGLAVDWTSDNLYWLTAGSLEVSRQGGSYQKALRRFNLANGNGGLVIHPKLSLLFWSHPAEANGIHRSTLNVDREKIIWPGYKQNPDNLAIDYDNQQLFWVMKTEAKVYYSDLEGGNIRTLPSIFTNPLALTVLASTTYCIDVRSRPYGASTQLALTLCQMKPIGTPSTAELFGNGSSGVNSTWGDQAAVSIGLPAAPSDLDPEPDPKCSSVDSCYLDYQSSPQTTALLFVSPFQQRNSGIVSPCGINNGGCEFLCLSLPQHSGYMCECPAGTSEFRCDRGIHFDHEDNSGQLPHQPPDISGMFPEAPQPGTIGEEQLRMVLVILVFLSAIVIVLVVGLLICVKRQVNKRRQAGLTVVGGSSTIAPGPYPPWAGGNSTLYVHSSRNGIYHSLPRQRCSLTTDNYLMPAGAAHAMGNPRFSTHSLQRQHRHAVPNNYVDINAHLPQRRRSSAGGLPNIHPVNGTLGRAPSVNAPIYHGGLWKPLPAAVAPNKNANFAKAVQNHSQQQQFLTHSPSASFSSVGSGPLIGGGVNPSLDAGPSPNRWNRNSVIGLTFPRGLGTWHPASTNHNGCAGISLMAQAAADTSTTAFSSSTEDSVQHKTDSV